MFARATLTLTAILLGGFCGCQSAQPRDAQNGGQPGDAQHAAATQPAAATDVPTASSAELMAWIGGQPLLTAEAGYRAAYVLWTGEMFAGDYAALRDKLVAADIADDIWNHAPQDYLTRADVGYLVCRAADIRTGLNWSLLGLGRYAYRELVYRDIAAPGGDLGLVGGGEFQGIARRADQYMARTGRSTGAEAQLGAAPH